LAQAAFAQACVDRMAAARCMLPVRAAIVARGSDGAWAWAPPEGILYYTPTKEVLGGNCRPFGQPPGLGSGYGPWSPADQEAADRWQRTRHEELQVALGGPVAGYAARRGPSKVPLMVRELPATVGTKVWRGEMLLWRFLSELEEGAAVLRGVRSVLELGAGCGACGLLLAGAGLDVAVSDLRSEDDLNSGTWENLVFNVAANGAAAEAGGGSLRAVALDWTSPGDAPQVDLAVGADIIYEPHLFPHLLATLRRAAPRAVIVQNVNRKGTAQFQELCAEAGVRLFAVPLGDGGDIAGLEDGRGGVFEAWILDIPPGE